MTEMFQEVSATGEPKRDNEPTKTTLPDDQKSALRQSVIEQAMLSRRLDFLNRLTSKTELPSSFERPRVISSSLGNLAIRIYEEPRGMLRVRASGGNLSDSGAPFSIQVEFANAIGNVQYVFDRTSGELLRRNNESFIKERNEVQVILQNHDVGIVVKRGLNDLLQSIVDYYGLPSSAVPSRPAASILEK